jgi:hypothetical protein
MYRDLAPSHSIFVECGPHFRYTLEGGMIMMKRVLETGSMALAVVLTVAPQVLANEAHGDGPPDYSGITGLYYVMIGGILAYGVYDTFLKKS